MWRYLKQVLIAFDQLINALLGGWADESLSAHAWRQHLEGKRDWPYQLIDIACSCLSTPTDGRGKEFPAYRRRIGPRKGCRNDKAQCANTGLSL